MSIGLNKYNEIHYTICPVGNASYIAANKGWLKNGLNEIGVEPILLQSLPKEYWSAHFNYQDNLLFREGGNIPPIWAKSNGAEVVLIGLTLLQQKQYIFVKADSEVDTIEQLRGRRIGIPAHPKSIIDFHKASAEHGFKIALASKGVSENSVEFIELLENDDFVANFNDKKSRFGQLEVDALESGEVDAIYIKSTQVQKLLDTGRFKVIFEINAKPTVLSPINNEYPNALTVSRELAEERPEIVIKYLKQLLLAADWAKDNRSEVLELFAAQTRGTSGQVACSHSFDFNRHLTPELSEETLGILDNQKRFLYDRGYLKNDFDILKWADDRYLKIAIEELKTEGR